MEKSRSKIQNPLISPQHPLHISKIKILTFFVNLLKIIKTHTFITYRHNRNFESKIINLYTLIKPHPLLSTTTTYPQTRKTGPIYPTFSDFLDFGQLDQPQLPSNIPSQLSTCILIIDTYQNHFNTHFNFSYQALL